MAFRAFTVATLRYLPKARVLAKSLKRFHPEIFVSLVLAESQRPPWLTSDEPFDEVIVIPQLGISDLNCWLFKHDLVEVCTAIKGIYIDQLLTRGDSEGVFYFDADIVILRELTSLIAELADASVLLTPHQVKPEESDAAVYDTEIISLQKGVFNLGFFAVRGDKDGAHFAKWWRRRLEKYCYAEVESGLFVDQKWVNLAPALFDGVKILRDPVFNVATWNLTHRKVSGSLREGLLVNGRPLVFYHFSGLDFGGQLTMLLRYGKEMPALFELRDWYIEECAREGQSELSVARWSYDWYENGEQIRKEHRVLYRRRDDLQSAFPNPFSTVVPGKSYLYWYLNCHEHERSSA
jgi:hypothetical protein